MMKFGTEKISFRRPNLPCSRSPKNVDENYFANIDTASKAYTLGIMITDGCVTTNNRVQIKMATEDRSIIDKIAADMKSEYKVGDYEYTHPNGRVQRYSQTSIPNTKLASRLREIGVCSRKTGKESFDVIDTVPSEFRRDFMRGVLDGDGSVSGRGDVSFYCANENFLTDVSGFLANEVGSNYRTPKYGNKVFNLHYAGYDSEMICDYMYYEGMELYLERKCKRCGKC